MLRVDSCLHLACVENDKSLSKNRGRLFELFFPFFRGYISRMAEDFFAVSVKDYLCRDGRYAEMLG